MPETKATAYTVYPDGYDTFVNTDRDIWTIQVEQTNYAADLWAVRHRGKCYSFTQPPSYEAIPSERTDEWLADYRHSLADALKLAEHVVPLLSINGMTAQQASDWVAARTDGARDA